MIEKRPLACLTLGFLISFSLGCLGRPWSSTTSLDHSANVTIILQYCSSGSVTFGAIVSADIFTGDAEVVGTFPLNHGCPVSDLEDPVVVYVNQTSKVLYMAVGFNVTVVDVASGSVMNVIEVTPTPYVKSFVSFVDAGDGILVGLAYSTDPSAPCLRQCVAFVTVDLLSGLLSILSSTPLIGLNLMPMGFVSGGSYWTTMGDFSAGFSVLSFDVISGGLLANVATDVGVLGLYQTALDPFSPSKESPVFAESKECSDEAGDFYGIQTLNYLSGGTTITACVSGIDLDITPLSIASFSPDGRFLVVNLGSSSPGADNTVPGFAALNSEDGGAYYQHTLNGILGSLGSTPTNVIGTSIYVNK